MRKILSASLFYCLLTSPCLAIEKNPLIGKWRWDSQNCKKPDFLFEESKVTHNTNADGVPVTSVFDGIKYEMTPEAVVVDFGKPHGFGKTPDTTKLTFTVVDANHVVIVRKKKSMNDLYRCPTTRATCDEKKFNQTETSIEHVVNWKQLYDFYEKYGVDCSESESIPDKIEKLLLEHWTTLADFAELAEKHPSFKKFVLDHIDSTMSDPKSIENLSSHKCMSNLSKLCGEIKAAARQALQ
jgi:hypothetical protein